MRIKEVLNSTEEEVTNKKFNIFIGISVGNKWFTKENLIGYIDLALKYTKSKVIILIADKIQAVNYNVRTNNSKNYSFRRALKNGDKLKIILEEIIDTLPRERKDRITIIRWEEYEKKDEFYNNYISVVYKFFNEENKFRDTVLQIVKETITDRKISEEDCLELSKYVLEEFLAIYSGISIGRIEYSLYFYPSIFPIVKLIEKIQNKEVFQELSEKLPNKKTSLAIIN